MDQFSPILVQLVAFVLLWDCCSVKKRLHKVVDGEEGVSHQSVVVGRRNEASGAAVMVWFEGYDRCLVEDVDSLDKFSHNLVQFL